MSLRCRDGQWCPGWFLPDHAPAYAVPSLFSPSVFCPWQSIELSEVMEQSTNYPWVPLPVLMKQWSFDYDQIWESWNYHCSTWLLKGKSNETIDNLMKKPYLDEKTYDLFILILLITSYYTMLHISRVKTHTNGDPWRRHFRWRKTAQLLSPSQGHPIASFPRKKNSKSPRFYVAMKRWLKPINPPAPFGHYAWL